MKPLTNTEFKTIFKKAAKSKLLAKSDGEACYYKKDEKYCIIGLMAHFLGASDTLLVNGTKNRTSEFPANNDTLEDRGDLRAFLSKKGLSEEQIYVLSEIQKKYDSAHPFVKMGNDLIKQLFEGTMSI
jgi:hypothetical protein